MSDDTRPETDASVEAFNQCHEGILRQLSQLGELPMLLEPARQARRLAREMLAFFRDVVSRHHRDEEVQLFPAVVAAAVEGGEREHVRGVVEQLTREHRTLEAAWARLEPSMCELAEGRDCEVSMASFNALLAAYTQHAHYEENAFLPMAQRMLGRQGPREAALGRALHQRLHRPEPPERFDTEA